VKEPWHSVQAKSKSSKKSKAGKEIILTIEKEFLQQYQTSVTEAYKTSLFAGVRVYRNRRQPFVTRESIDKLLAESETLPYVVVDGAIASSGDLAFVYGVVENKDHTKSGYMRIWRREKEGWKIIIDVLGR
ncbi:MAG: nuclear transport factor 2 family protein, partial [Flammeovirgaceae bacterium]|nr:nuclear transport factor 2 family protein [Flammeovirgaceae bacterium]